MQTIECALGHVIVAQPLIALVLCSGSITSTLSTKMMDSCSCTRKHNALISVYPTDAVHNHRYPWGLPAIDRTRAQEHKLSHNEERYPVLQSKGIMTLQTVLFTLSCIALKCLLVGYITCMGLMCPVFCHHLQNLALKQKVDYTC